MQPSHSETNNLITALTKNELSSNSVHPIRINAAAITFIPHDFTPCFKKPFEKKVKKPMETQTKELYKNPTGKFIQIDPKFNMDLKVKIRRLPKITENQSVLSSSHLSKELVGNKTPSFLTNRRKKSMEIPGFIGVEYIIKIISPNDIVYECTLCKQSYNEKIMQKHLVGNMHRLKYMRIHYPSIFKKFKPYLNCPQLYNSVLMILGKLSKAIETYHGRNVPFVYSAKQFIFHQKKIKKTLTKIKHAGETNGPSFAELVEKADLMQLQLILEKQT